MTGEKRLEQSGKFNLLTLILLAALGLGIYSAVKFVPIYIEKSRVSRLVEQAANQWANVNPNLQEVRKELQYNLEVAQVTAIHEQDVNFARVGNNEIEAWVDYEVVVVHPFDLVEPTVLEFNIYHTSARSTGGSY